MILFTYIFTFPFHILFFYRYKLFLFLLRFDNFSFWTVLALVKTQFKWSGKAGAFEYSHKVSEGPFATCLDKRFNSLIFRGRYLTLCWCFNLILLFCFNLYFIQMYIIILTRVYFFCFVCWCLHLIYCSFIIRLPPFILYILSLFDASMCLDFAS